MPKRIQKLCLGAVDDFTNGARSRPGERQDKYQAQQRTDAVPGMVGADGQHGHLAVRHHSPPAVFVRAGIPATFSKHSAVAETSVSYGWRNSGRRSRGCVSVIGL